MNDDQGQQLQDSPDRLNYIIKGQLNREEFKDLHVQKDDSNLKIGVSNKSSKPRSTYRSKVEF
jgi:hypothetical protein